MLEAGAATARKRSRAGCHTCKTRKVKCESSPRESGNDAQLAPQCVNCQRLGFQCRWQPPVAGENYEPPPKRRRAVGQRHGRPGENEDKTVTKPSDTRLAMGRDVQRGPEPSAVVVESRDARTSQPSDDQADLFEGFPFDLGFGFASGPLDLNLAGEGLDFVPLPAVDASMLQELTSFTASSNWPTTSSTQAPNTTSIDSGDLGELDGSHTSVNSNNRRLIQHYLDVMKGYAKVDDRSKDANNLFISAFTKSLYFPPLFHAILAFSASHLAMEDASYAGQAKDFATLAGASFETFRDADNFEADGLLSALFVRVKTVHMVAGSVDSFLDLIAAAADIVSTKQAELTLDTSPLTGRIILRLAILDARATYHRIGGGRLVNLLRDIPAFFSLFDRDFTVTASEGALFNLLRADILRMRVAELDVRLHAQLESEFVMQAPIRTDEVKNLYADIEYEIDQWNSQMAEKMDISVASTLVEEEVLSSVAYGYYIVFSALHSALLYLYSVYPLPSFNPERSISLVLHCQLKVSNDPLRAASPSSILPSSIFMAGLVTSDSVHRYWILQLLKAGERWGVYVKKARELLEAMLRHPQQVDIRDMMDRVTGRFII